MKKKIFGIIGGSSITTTVLTAMNAFADDTASSTTASAQTGNPLFTLVLPLVFMFAILYFMAIRPQKKQEQELKNMQNSLEVGDEIVTRDGIIGMIVRIGEDNVVIETGGDRTKIRIKTWAIAENTSATERIKAAENAAKKSGPSVSSAGLSEDEPDKKSKKNKKENSDAE